MNVIAPHSVADELPKEVPDYYTENAALLHRLEKQFCSKTGKRLVVRVEDGAVVVKEFVRD